MPVRKSLASRILVPVLLLTVVTFAAVLALVGRATSKVREDYDRLTLAAAASHVTFILDLAVSELTSARLADNPFVQEAKRGSVVVSVRSFWSRTDLDGLIVDGDGALVTSSLMPDVARAVVAANRGGFYLVDAAGERLRCLSEPFPLWGWTVVTVGKRPPLAQVRPELASLLPMLAAGALVLAAAVLLVLWRNLRTPVAHMVADVDADREVRPAGVAELDRVGAAVNSAMARLRARTADVAAELDRRRDTERALAERDAHIRLLLDSSGEGIFGLDSGGVCTFCNAAALRMLGYASQEEVLGKEVHGLLHHTRPGGAHYHGDECPVLRTTRLGVAARVTDDSFWRKDGTDFRVEYWSCPVLEEGVQRGAVVGFVDITERTTLEEQLRQAQKMEAVGRLAGGIAHDFNNMLMAIIGNATLARESVAEGSSVQADLDQVLAAADKAAGLTRQILAFSRKRTLSLAPVDVNEVVQGMSKVLAGLLGEDVDVELQVARGELVVMADRAQLEQVLLNLWTNARDAMPSGGSLVVGTRAVTIEAAAAAELGLEAPGRYALLTVRDDGPGMDEEIRRRVFEPFFTTKEQGKGTGLGLSIAFGIVKQHHGQIRVESAPGAGATFSIWLPLTTGAAVRAPSGSSAEARGGSEIVLLAEDNEHVRALARSVLEGAGYRVLTASDGMEAVALYDSHAEEVALCLLDVVMPRLGGREALQAIRHRRAGARALLMSGYAPDDAVREAESAILLSKPIVPRELLRRVREALDA